MERAASCRTTFRPDQPLMLFNNIFAQCESKPQSVVLSGEARIHAVKPLEDVVEVLAGDTLPMIADADREYLIRLLPVHLHESGSIGNEVRHYFFHMFCHTRLRTGKLNRGDDHIDPPPLWRVDDGIREQVIQHLTQPQRVRKDKRNLMSRCATLVPELQEETETSWRLFCSPLFGGSDCIARQHNHIGWHPLQMNRPLLKLANLKQAINH